MNPPRQLDARRWEGGDASWALRRPHAPDIAELTAANRVCQGFVRHSVCPDTFFGWPSVECQSVQRATRRELPEVPSWAPSSSGVAAKLLTGCGDSHPNMAFAPLPNRAGGTIPTMRPAKPVLRAVGIALLAFTLTGCDLSDCFCHKKKGTDWAAVNRVRSGSGGGASGGGGGTGGGGNAVPEISPRAAVAGLTLLGGLVMILVDCRRGGRGTLRIRS
jgi:hypothetical protein